MYGNTEGLSDFEARSQNCEKRLLASSRLSVCPHATRLPKNEFSWKSIFALSKKLVLIIKIQRQHVLYMKTTVHLWEYLAQFFLEWEMFQTKVVEKIKTHISCSITLSRSRAVYEIMWKNTSDLDRPQMITLRMRIACWIPKALQKRWRERASMLRYTSIASLVLSQTLLRWSHHFIYCGHTSCCSQRRTQWNTGWSSSLCTPDDYNIESYK
jgi:hypothetical protein